MNKISKGIRFHDQIAKRWNTEYKTASFIKRFNIFKFLIDKYQNKNEVWLDLGCGSGTLTTVISKKAKLVLAVDGSKKMVDETKKKANQIKNIITKCNDISEIDKIVDFPLDGILCSSVLEYMDEPYKIIEDYLKHLKNGGIFIFSVPPTKSITRLISKIINNVGKIFGKSFFTYIEYSKFEFDPIYLKKFINNVGKIIEIYDFDHYLPRIFLKIFRPSLKIFVIKKL